jgi:hypothetical protein
MTPVILGILIARVFAAGAPPQLDCVTIKSPSKLSAGSAFSARIQYGLEFMLSKDWGISVRPAAQGEPDYLWLVSPPLRTAPHRMFGAGYGFTAAQSAALNRSLRFVLNQTDYDAAMDAIGLPDPAETLKRLDALGRGTLVLYVDKYELDGNAFKWISFHGEACVPR